MPIRAQSADGVIHEFPDGTDPSVVDRAMKTYAQSAQPEQSTGEWLGDQAKFLGGRVANAAMSLPGLPADLVGLQLRGMDWLAGNKTPTANPLEAISGQTIRDAAHDYGSQAINAMGFKTTPEDLAPRDPRNVAEQYAGNVADFIGYGGGPAALSKGALTTAATGAAGLTAAQVIAPDSPVAQIAGAIIGHRIPAAIASRGASVLPTTRAFLRGKDPGDVTDELAAYDRLAQQTGKSAEIMPGQLAGTYNMQQTVDALIARSPGGQSGVLRANESQAQLLDDAINKAASNPTGKLNVGAPSSTSTGNKILSDFEASAEKFRTRQTKIEQAFERVIGARTRVDMNNTGKAVLDLKARTADDAAVGNIVNDSTIAKIEKALAESQGTLSYSAARALRTDIGDLLPKAGLLGDVKAGQLKKLYGALSEDINAVAKQRGVGTQWDRYNKWASSNYDRTAKVYDKLTKGREFAPEKVAEAFSRQDATAMRIAMKNLSPEGRSMAAGQILFDAAKTKAAGAAADDVATSYQKFLGNLLEMKQGGQNSKFNAVFGAPEFAPLRQTIDDLERVSKSALRANKVSHDVSGATVVRAGAAGSIGTLALTGQIPAAAGVFALTFLAPAVAGKVLRSRAYLNWLTYARQAKPNEMRQVLQRLSMIAVRDRDPETREALQQMVPVVSGIVEQQPPQE